MIKLGPPRLSLFGQLYSTITRMIFHHIHHFHQQELGLLRVILRTRHTRIMNMLELGRERGKGRGRGREVTDPQDHLGLVWLKVLKKGR